MLSISHLIQSPEVNSYGFLNNSYIFFWAGQATEKLVSKYIGNPCICIKQIITKINTLWAIDDTIRIEAEIDEIYTNKIIIAVSIYGISILQNTELLIASGETLCQSVDSNGLPQSITKVR